MSFRLPTRVLSQSLRTISRCSSSRQVLQSIASRRSISLVQPRLFSTSSIRCNATSNLRQILADEINHETSNSSSGFPDELASFIGSSGFQVINTDGQALAKLEKHGQDEIVHVFFDINQAVNIRAGANEELEGLEDSEELDDPFDALINLNVVLENTKTNTALAFDALVSPEDGNLLIENVTAYEDKTAALTEGAEFDHKRELSYNGPAFSNLDESLQSELEALLEEKGFNIDLYQFILNYGIYKENEEYIAWLEKLNKFFKN